jgi:hypothetical protein
MTDLDHASLDRILPSTPGSADWDDVMSRFRMHQGRRRRRLVVLVAAALVAAGTASAFGSVRDFILDRGFVGLPPLGASPSTPEKGKLVLSYFGPGGEQDWGKRRFWVYADGRLITLREANLPEGANERSTGLLEQHLTPKGVELLRSERISTGRIVPEDLSGLPASAWEDRKIRAYVPSRYAVCYGGWSESERPIDASRVFTLLPAPAADLLRSRDKTRHDGKRGLGGDLHPDYHYCSNVTTREARAIAEALDHPGLEKVDQTYWLAFQTRGPNRETIDLWFAAILPDGRSVCSPCG